MTVIEFFMPVIIMFVVVGAGVTFMFLGKNLKDKRRTAADGTKIGSNWLHVTFFVIGALLMASVIGYLLVTYVFGL